MFIETFEFEKMWADLKLDDDELCELQGYLLKHPDAGRTMQGTGGVRKLRWGIKKQGRGKSGGARVIFIDFMAQETIYLVTAYGKNERDDLTADERKQIKAFVKRIE
jgi:hypothetical protein